MFLGLGVTAWWRDNQPQNNDQGSNRVAEASTKQKTLQNYDADAFKDLYNSFAYPNTQEVTTPPSITGQPKADIRIREIAEKRGYTLRSVPVSPILKTGERDLEGDDLLQPLALSAWQDIKAAAEKDGIPLRLLSGYRSMAYQRELFVQRLYAAGAYPVDIANGIADAKVDSVLKLTAPPGYSRHHTGYTVDFACYPNGVFMSFVKSPCFEWIKADNYRVAKENGWIPSYPEGADEQGPEPEAWEYVWIGVDNLSR